MVYTGTNAGTRRFATLKYQAISLPYNYSSIPPLHQYIPLSRLPLKSVILGSFAKRTCLQQFAAGRLHIGAFARKIIADGAAQRRISDMVGRIGCVRQIPAGEL